MQPKRGGGKRYKKTKNQSTEADSSQPIPFAEVDQMYAVAIKMLGNRRLSVKCTDGKERLAIIPGKFKGKHHWVSPGMFLLLNVREYQEEKVDVVYIYNAREVNRLQKLGELNELIEKEDTIDSGFVFETDITEEIDLFDL